MRARAKSGVRAQAQHAEPRGVNTACSDVKVAEACGRERVIMSMQHAVVSTQGRGGRTGGMGMAQKRARNDSKQKENNRNQKKGTYTRMGCGQFVVALFCHGDEQVSP